MVENSSDHRLLMKTLMVTPVTVAVLIITFACWQWSLVASYRSQLLRLKSDGIANAYYNATDEQYVIDLETLPYRSVAGNIAAPRCLLTGFVPKLDLRGFHVADISTLSDVNANVRQLEVKGVITKAKELEAILTHFPNVTFLQTGEIVWTSEMEAVLAGFSRPLTIIAVATKTSDAKLPEKIGTKVFIQWFYHDTEER